LAKDQREKREQPRGLGRTSHLLDKYLKEIGQEDLLTTEEEIALSEVIRKGGREGEKATEKLIKANLRFVVSVAKQYQNQGLTLNDLINEGNMGLIKAAYRFDITRGFKFISYEMAGLSSNIQSWLSKVRLKDLHQVCFSNTARNKLKTVCFFEEAKMLFSETLHQSSTSVDFSKQIVTQGRSPGLGSVITDQNKNELADFVLNNLSVQICLNLSSPKEMRLTGYSMGCANERQIEQLRYLKIPYAVISKAGYPPFLFRIPKSPVKRHISNEELIEIVKPRLANLSAIPSQGPQRAKINLTHYPNYEIRQAPKPKTLKDYLKDIKSFLEQVKNNLQLNISKLYESLKLSGRKGDKLKGQLLENGLIEEEILRTGERKRPSKTLKLTAKGERIFSWLKQKVKEA